MFLVGVVTLCDGGNAEYHSINGAFALFMLDAAHNGLGYIYFKGTKTISVNYHKAFAHFNIVSHVLELVPLCH